MSFAPIGAMLIDKGIDQFTFGVGQEYRRHERHALRDYEEYDRIQDRKWYLEDDRRLRSRFEADRENERAYDAKKFSREFHDKMAMSKQYGIHPLAMMGSTSQGSPVVSSPGSRFSPSTGGGKSAPPIQTPSSSHNFFPRPSADEKRIQNAKARQEEAKASAMEQSLKNQGQSSHDFDMTNTKFIEGQHDSDMFDVDFPKLRSKNVGIDAKVSKGQKHYTDQEGNFYTVPQGDLQQAVSEEGTLKNRILYEFRDLNLPRKVSNLRKNWNDPKLQSFKKRWLSTRPNSNNPNEVVLWNGTNWQAFYKTSKNQHRIFANKQPILKARLYKRKPYKERWRNERVPFIRNRSTGGHT